MQFQPVGLCSLFLLFVYGTHPIVLCSSTWPVPLIPVSNMKKKQKTKQLTLCHMLSELKRSFNTNTMKEKF